MNGIYRRRKVFYKSFLTYFLLLLAVIVIGSGSYLQLLKKERTAAITNSFEKDAGRIVTALDEKQSRLKSIGANVSQTLWIQKLLTPADTFQGDFTTPKRQEYQSDLLRYTILDDAILDVAVLFPEKNLVVTQSSWFQTEEFAFYLENKRKLDYDSVIGSQLDRYHSSSSFQTLEYNREDHPFCLLLQSLEQIGTPRAVLLVILDRSVYEESLRALAGESVRSIRIVSRDGHTLFSTAQETEAGAGTGPITMTSSVYSISYELAYPDPQEVLQIEEWVDLFFWLMLFCCVLLACLVSYLLSTLSYRPLKKLLEGLSGIHGSREEPAVSEYEQIGNSLHHLYDENQSMRQSVEQYGYAAKNNTLFRLLKGDFAGDGEQQPLLGTLRIPVSQGYAYGVLLLLRVEEENPPAPSGLDILPSVRESLLHCQLTFELTESIEGGLVVILSFEEVKGAEEALDHACSELRKALESSRGAWDILRGRVYSGVLGISKSYQTIRQSLAAPPQEALPVFSAGQSFYYPTDWEIQLISRLKEGNLPVVSRILEELRKENEDRKLAASDQYQLFSLLLQTVMRVIYELHIDPEALRIHPQEVLEGSASSDSGWGRLIRFAAEVCMKNLQQQSEYSQHNDTVQQIVSYVNQNFTAPSLSLKELGSQFGLSVQAVSRLFKSATSVNFSDYLTRLRMERSKELMRQLGYRPQEIAMQVGYENEYSFKRAFLRTENCRPRDYYSRLQQESADGS